jgi:hypothetical protein
MRNLLATALIVAMAAPPGVSAQVARSLGINGVSAAMASGSEAGLSNPAALARAGRDLSFFGISGGGWLHPFGLAHLNSFGAHLDAAAKSSILSEIRASGKLALDASASAHWVGASMGGAAINLYTVAAGQGTVPPAAAELILFGNVGEHGDAEVFDLTGFNGSGHVSTVLATSYGAVIASPLEGRTSIGATLRTGLIHVRGMGEDISAVDNLGNRYGSILRNDPVELTLHGDVAIARSGFLVGLDLAGEWEGERVRVGLILQDVITTQAYDIDRVTLKSIVGTVSMEDSSTINTAEVSARDLPKADQQLLLARLRTPLTRSGVTLYGASPALRGEVATAISLSAGDMGTNAIQFAAGAEQKLIGPVSARAAAMLGERNASVSAGLTIRMGTAGIDFGASRRSGDLTGWAFAGRVAITGR